MDQYFVPLIGAHDEIYDDLRQSARNPRFLVAPFSFRYIAFHVRRGDFASRPAASVTNTATPIEWFAAAARAFRDAETLKEIEPCPIVVCSDGLDSDLRPLLSIPSVYRSRGANPLQDLSLLRSADLIVGSGSTFSAWGAFLGSQRILLDEGQNHYLQDLPMAVEANVIQLPDAVASLG